MSDLTLISKVSNEAINDNLKKRFENREIYVWSISLRQAITVVGGFPSMSNADGFL